MSISVSQKSGQKYDRVNVKYTVETDIGSIHARDVKKYFKPIGFVLKLFGFATEVRSTDKHKSYYVNTKSFLPKLEKSYFDKQQINNAKIHKEKGEDAKITESDYKDFQRKILFVRENPKYSSISKGNANNKTINNIITIFDRAYTFLAADKDPLVVVDFRNDESK